MILTLLGISCCLSTFVHYSSKYTEAAEPFLDVSTENHLHACERHCNAYPTCLYGTYYQDDHKCTISSKRREIVVCTDCDSFVRILGRYGVFGGRQGKTYAMPTLEPTPWPLLMKLDDDDGSASFKKKEKKLREAKKKSKPAAVVVKILSKEKVSADKTPIREHLPWAIDRTGNVKDVGW